MKVKSESEVAELCPILSEPMDCSLPRLLRPWDFPGKSTGVGCHCTYLKSLIHLQHHHTSSFFLFQLAYNLTWHVSLLQLRLFLFYQIHI